MRRAVRSAWSAPALAFTAGRRRAASSVSALLAKALSSLVRMVLLLAGGQYAQRVAQAVGDPVRNAAERAAAAFGLGALALGALAFGVLAGGALGEVALGALQLQAIARAVGGGGARRRRVVERRRRGARPRAAGEQRVDERAELLKPRRQRALLHEAPPRVAHRRAPRVVAEDPEGGLGERLRRRLGQRDRL